MLHDSPLMIAMLWVTTSKGVWEVKGRVFVRLRYPRLEFEVGGRAID